MVAGWGKPHSGSGSELLLLLTMDIMPVSYSLDDGGGGGGGSANRNNTIFSS